MWTKKRGLQEYYLFLLIDVWCSFISTGGAYTELHSLPTRRKGEFLQGNIKNKICFRGKWYSGNRALWKYLQKILHKFFMNWLRKFNKINRSHRAEQITLAIPIYHVSDNIATRPVSIKVPSKECRFSASTYKRYLQLNIFSKKGKNWKWFIKT